MSSRSEATTSTKAAWSKSTPANCPPASAENLGQYIPGCPGYGRRDVVPALSSRQTNSLQSLIPMLEMLIQQLPKLISNNNFSGIAEILSDIGASTTAATASPSKAAVASAFKVTATSSSTSIKKSKASAVSTAKLTLNTRDLFEADGFQKRQDGNTDSGASQSGNTGGLNVSILDDLLNGLLGGLLGTSSKRDVQQNGNKGGVNVEVLNGLLNNLLGGNSLKRSEQNGNKGGINIELLNGLLNNVLGGNHIKRAIFSMAARHVIQARADFEPVWDEIKKIGNDKFQARNLIHGSQTEKLMTRSEFTPVWTSFRDMIDASFKEGKSTQKRSPFPEVGTTAFSHATTQFLKQKVFGKRDTDFQPLKQAATTFAKTQLKQWTDLIKSHKQ